MTGSVLRTSNSNTMTSWYNMHFNMRPTSMLQSTIIRSGRHPRSRRMSMVRVKRYVVLVQNEYMI